jgi:hypothetical protein
MLENSRVRTVLDLGPEDTFTGIMWYFEGCYGVSDLPHFPGRPWDELLSFANQLAERKFHQSLDFGFLADSDRLVVDRVTTARVLAELDILGGLNPETGRIYLNAMGRQFGTEFGIRFPLLAQEIFLEACSMSGFIVFG